MEVIPILPSNSKHKGKFGEVKKRGKRRITVIFDNGSNGYVDFTFLKIVEENDKSNAESNNVKIVGKIQEKMNKIEELLSQIEF